MPNKIKDEELKTIKGIAGAKGGLVIGAKLDMLKSKFLAIPVIIGGTAAAFLSGKETDSKVKKVLNLVKKGDMNKAQYIFEKKAIGAMGVGMIGLVGLSLAPKPRKTATKIINQIGKNIKMKKLVKLPRKK